MESNGTGFTPYEQVKISHMQSKKASGVAIGALATAVGAGVVAVGGALWAGSKAQNAKEIAVAKNDGLRDLVQTLAATVAAERVERISGDTNISQTITDTISGQQQGSQSQSQTTAIDNTVTTIMQKTLEDAITGRSSLNPTPVNIYSAPHPCGCPGCGCNR